MIAADPLSEFLARLQGVRRIGDRWEAKCPAHDDRRASLSITTGDRGAVLAKCHAGCPIEQIAGAVGMSVRDLFPPREPSDGQRQRGRIVETYPYSDENGELLYEVCRFDPKDFRQRRPDGRGGWDWHLNGTRRLLYRLADLLNSADDDPASWVLVTEGEKDVEALRRAGFIATCNSGGAGKWRDEYSETLRGRRCCIIADKDGPGRKHAEQVAASLQGKAAEVRVVELPGEGVKDAADFLAAGGTAADLRNLIHAAPVWRPVNHVEEALNVGRAKQDERVKSDSLPDAAPLTLARAFLQANYIRNGNQLLRHWRGAFYEHDGAVYAAAVKEQLRSRLYAFLERQRIDTPEGPVTFSPTRRKLEDVLDALAAVSQAEVATMPAWIGPDLAPASRLIAFRNGLLDIESYLAGEPKLIPPTPRWFSANVLPFEFTPTAPEPARWWDFLAELWDLDTDSVELLREWFGYCMTADTSLQKILLLVGPTRSGKGTIARTLTKLIGAANVCGPTLSGLASNFGLWGLMGKQLAILSDARMSGRADQAAVVERLLTISGEDAITIDRKNLEPVTLTLPTRLMVISNELPRLADASGALADRFMVLALKRSFLGHEDTGLDAKLAAELPGICLWALEGLRRIRKQRRFTVPVSSTEAVEELHDLTSPVKAFLRECCIIAPGRQTTTASLFERWSNWCKSQGREHAGSLQSFGRDIRAAVPGIEVKQRREAGQVERVYEGIGIG